MVSQRALTLLAVLSNFGKPGATFVQVVAGAIAIMALGLLLHLSRN
jgi:hypothetical protein